ncbi:MAG: caspase family protein, partial [Acidobacteria bacterium]|nr:caspase family protein [Acidobacteriota bacterium]
MSYEVMKKTAFVLILLLAALSVDAAPRKRALLIGIDNYSALRPVPSALPSASDGRDFPNLDGSVNDVNLMRELLLAVYGFKAEDVVVLKDETATRDGILGGIDDLVRDAQRGDVLLFYFSGHGSQVFNSLSAEDDRMDESIVPADTKRGALDVRDKELRRHLFPSLDRGARLTVILDSCHSGSGARGLPGGGKPRFGTADMRDVRDGWRGPTLEDRGALILAAAQSSDIAFETPDDEKHQRGVFSWALARALRDATSGEPAIDTFQRVAARMRLERPDQVPALSGNDDARFTPLFGSRVDRDRERVVAAVRSVRDDGVVTINGGWANGLTRGSELRLPDSSLRLQVTTLRGMTECDATVKTGAVSSIHSGSLVELTAWAAPESQPLRVYVPIGDEKAVRAARKLRQRARAKSIEWIDDPIAGHATRVLRWNGQTFDDSGASAKSIFVQLPVPVDIDGALRQTAGVNRVARAEDADYILAGRLTEAGAQYAWIRPGTDQRDMARAALPLRTDWRSGAPALDDDLRRLRRIQMWQTLPSPPESRFNYRLGIVHASDNRPVTNGRLVSDQKYGLVLRAADGPRDLSKPRYVYAFTVDSYGKSVLLFPRGPLGSVENRFPTFDTTPPEIRLGAGPAFTARPPLGSDTYYLLSTEEALVNPWVLEWDGVRTPAKGERPASAFEQLLTLIMTDGDRGAVAIDPQARWSIERL